MRTGDALSDQFPYAENWEMLYVDCHHLIFSREHVTRRINRTSWSCMQAVNNKHRASLSGEVLALIYMGTIAFSAQKNGFPLLLFPELAALSHDV
jgi:hypothetical protein